MSQTTMFLECDGKRLRESSKHNGLSDFVDFIPPIGTTITYNYFGDNSNSDNFIVVSYHVNTKEYYNSSYTDKEFIIKVDRIKSE